MPITDYADRQDEKRDRLEERAEKHQIQGAARVYAGSESFYQMNGQPILVGHHSEKSHRSAIKRADNNLRKGYEQQAYGRELAGRADRLGSGGASADDPEAVATLETRAAALERKRDQYKAMNAAWRKAKRPHSDNDAGWRLVALKMGLDYDGAAIVALRRGQSENYVGNGRQPVESWMITNLSRNIRSTRQRIQDLRDEYARQADGGADDIQGDGYTVTEDTDENRLCVFFDERISKEQCRGMKLLGWRWNRRLGCWSRLLNQASRYSATQVPAMLETLSTND